MNSFKPLLLSLLLLLTPPFANFVNAAEAQPLYDLSFHDLDRNAVSLSEYRGKVVLLNFWATWCPPCIKEMPSMQRLKEHFAGQPFEIVAINAGEDATTVSSFLLELDTDLTFTILLDEQSRSFREFKLRGLPMSLLFDKNGQPVASILGGREWDSTASEQLINKALKADSSDKEAEK